MEQNSPLPTQSFWRECGLSIPQIQTSGPQNYEEIYFCFLKPSSLESFVIAVLGIQYRFWFWKVWCCYNKYLKMSKWHWNLFIEGRGILQCLIEKASIFLKRPFVEI
jgi:hypothetical protein